MKKPVPAPPWKLTGKALAMLQRTRVPSDALDSSSVAKWLLAKLPQVLALVHYELSPVGAYNERAVAIITVRGASVVEMQVDSEESRRGGRENWGYPKTRAELAWHSKTSRGVVSRIVFTRGSEVCRARVLAPAVPFRFRAFTLQTLNGQEVRVPIALRGRAHLAFCGRRLAVYAEFSMVVAAPRAAGRKNARSH